MKNNNYWKQRAEIIANRQNKKADNYIVDLERQYKKALASIQKDLEVFYGRYADAEGVDMAIARKLLTNAEKEMWEVSLEEYRRMSLDEQFKAQIESMYSKSRVSRLQVLQTQIRANIEVLHSDILEDGTDLLKATFTDTYYRAVYEIEKGTGIATNFARFDEDTVLQITSKPWKHGSFSSNWDDCKRNLLDELETTLAQAFIRGDSMDKVIKNFAKRMNVDKKRAARIVLTEHSYIANEASFKSYQETGVERYEYLATLDLHTSEICQSMDGKVFKLSEKMVGVNYPPLHPWCRSTTVPYFEDLDTWVDERASRDPATGKTKNVFADTKYPQWYEENVIGAQKVSQYEKELGDWIKGKKGSVKKLRIDLEFFSENDWELLQNKIEAGLIDGNAFESCYNEFEKSFSKGILTPLGNVKSRKDSFAHIAQRHPEMVNLIHIDRIKEVLENPQAVYISVDANKREADMFIKKIENKYLTVFVRGDIITSYYISNTKAEKLMKGVLKWERE